MKILVTGSAGFIGSRVFYILRANSNFVSGVDRKDGPTTTYLLDLSDPRYASFLPSEGIDAIVHLAAAPWAEAQDWSKAGRDTIISTVRALDLAARCHAAFVLASSAYVLGEPLHAPQGPGHPRHPVDNYGKAKLMAEELTWAWALPRTFVTRFYNVYGPGQYPGAVIPDTIAKLQSKDHQLFEGSGNETRDFVYVDDVAEAIRLLVTEGQPGTYHIGSGTPTRIADLVALCKDLLGSTTPYSFRSLPSSRETKARLRGFLIPFQADIAPMLKLGWKPRDLKTGLASFIRQEAR